MTSIYIKDLVVLAKHGVAQREKEQAQRFNISVELSTDISKALNTDDLADTLDWSELRRQIIQIVQRKSHNLVEVLAADIADQLLKDKRIKQISVAVDKLDAFDSGIPGIRLSKENTN